jgi:hypothetical protein
MGVILREKGPLECYEENISMARVNHNKWKPLQKSTLSQTHAI